MQPKNGNLSAPELRFPEFLGAAKWEFVPLNKLAKRCTRKNRGEAITRVLTNSSEYGVVDQRDYFDKDIATKGNLEGYYVVEKGDYVYNPRISASAPVGPISKNNIATGVMSPLYLVFRFGEVNNDFYAYYFKTTGWHQYVRQASSTGARHDRMAISNDDFMAMPLPVSTPEEQQKIAKLLVSFEERIFLEIKKLDALKRHKKGLVQRLFPAEGEVVPVLRFPEFRESGEWEKKQLSQLGELVSGLTYSPEDVRDAGLLVLRSSNVQGGRIALDDNVYVRADMEGASPTRENDILICVRNGSKSLIGKNALVPRGMPPCTHGAFMTIFRAKSARFVFQLFQTDAYARQVSADLGATINSINGGKLKKYVFFVPKGPEQEKIADFLASLDAAIDAQSQKVDSLKIYKNGLMQKLFPRMDEVGV